MKPNRFMLRRNRSRFTVIVMTIAMVSLQLLLFGTTTRMVRAAGCDPATVSGKGALSISPTTAEPSDDILIEATYTVDQQYQQECADAAKVFQSGYQLVLNFSSSAPAAKGGATVRYTPDPYAVRPDYSGGVFKATYPIKGYRVYDPNKVDLPVQTDITVIFRKGSSQAPFAVAIGKLTVVSGVSGGNPGGGTNPPPAPNPSPAPGPAPATPGACVLGDVKVALGKTSVATAKESIPITVTIATAGSPAGKCDYDFDQWSVFQTKAGPKQSPPARIKDSTTAPQPITLSGTFTLESIGVSDVKEDVQVVAHIKDHKNSDKETLSAATKLGDTSGAGAGGSPSNTPGAGGGAMGGPGLDCGDTFCNPVDVNSLPEFIIKIMRILLVVIGMISVIMIIYGGFTMVISQGNADGVKRGKQTIIWAIGGLVVALLSFSIVSIVQNLLGKK